MRAAELLRLLPQRPRHRDAQRAHGAAHRIQHVDLQRFPRGFRKAFVPHAAHKPRKLLGPGHWKSTCNIIRVIRKLKSGGYRLYSKKRNPQTGKRRNLGTFHTREEAEQHEREVQFFKRAH